MVSSKNVCIRDKTVRYSPSPSPEPFREPENMTSIDLNEMSDKFPQNVRKPQTAKRLCVKFMLYLLAIKLIIVLACVMAILLSRQNSIFSTKKQSIYVSDNKEQYNKLSIPITRTPNAFKDQLTSTNYISEKQDYLDICRFTRTLEDCCEIFFDTELAEVAELCTVNDVLEILINFEKNHKHDRSKRQILHPDYNIPPSDQDYQYEYENINFPDIEYSLPDLTKFENVKRKTDQSIQYPNDPNMAYEQQQYFDPNSNNYQEPNYDYPPPGYYPNSDPQIRNSEIDKQFVPDMFAPIPIQTEPKNMQPNLPPPKEIQATIAQPGNMNTQFIPQNIQKTEANFVNPNTRPNQDSANVGPYLPVPENIQDKITQPQKYEQNNIPVFESIHPNINVNKKNINSQYITQNYEKTKADFINPNRIQEKLQPHIEKSDSKSVTLDKPFHIKQKVINNPQQFQHMEKPVTTGKSMLHHVVETNSKNQNNGKTKQLHGNNYHNKDDIRAKSNIENISSITGTNKTVQLDFKNTSIHLFKTSKPKTTKIPIKNSTNSPTTTRQKQNETLTTVKIEARNFAEEVSTTLPLNPKPLSRFINQRTNEERGFRQKTKIDSLTDDIQVSQQSINPCMYSYPTPFGSPYKLTQSFDNTQMLKIIPVSQQPKMQQPVYVLNPPMYSYIPPQAPYIQSYAAPMQQHYNPYNNPIQVSGPGGQYYTCNPIPPPSNNIATLPGVEVRSASLQDILEEESMPKPMSNKTRSSIDCPIGERSCEDGSKCIKNQQVCDNEVNCDDASDEIFCSCKERVGKFRACDGYFDCPNGEDEQNCFGCRENEFSCDDWSRFRQSTCIPIEQRCDNIRQCEVTGKDEEDCSVLTDHVGTLTQYKISNAVGFLHRNYKGKWYPTCFGTELWAMDVCKIEAGPSSINPRSHMMITSNSYSGLFINIRPNNEISLVPNCVQDRAAFVECPPLYCGLRLIVKNPYRNQEVDTSIENIVNNFERKTSNFPGYRRNKNESDIVGISRVVGGRPSQPAAWPWIVSIYKNGIFHCGGVLINELWIVTAAHCVDKYWQYYYEVQAGMLRRFSFSPMEQNRWAAQAIPHEDYDKSNLKNDIALMRLSSPIRYNRYVRPICLPSETTAGRDFLRSPSAGTICTTVGWGATVEHGADPDNMREVEIPVLPSCKHKEDREGEEICAGLSEGGKDACQGDSGGPFMCRNPNNPSQWYLAGVVSHGEGCARPNEPGVYTRVSKYVGWIAENIRDDKFVSKVPRQVCPGYICKNTGKCLPKKRRCDNIIDCLMGDDETECENSFRDIFKHSRKTYMVGAARNISEVDGRSTTVEEAIGVDGNSSSTTEKSVKRMVHHGDFFKCKLMLQIIPQNRRCDKIIDCEDGTDEADCVCADYVRNSNPHAICDGITDCYDLSDEIDCLKCNYSTHYQCRLSQQCIELSKRCDGVADCRRHEDERDCAALTNGSTLTLDSDLRPKLSTSGIITINRFGVWRPLCTNMSDNNEASIATNVCNLLGFEEYTAFHKYPVVRDRATHVAFQTFQIVANNHNQHDDNSTCVGLFVRCSNISLDSAVYTVYQDHLGNSDVELYTSPWNAVIYADGIYRCMGTILETSWIVTSINCFNGITTLKDHYVVVLLGQRKSQLDVEGPYEQTIRVVETIQIEQSDVILLRLQKDIVYNRYIRPAHIRARRDFLHPEKCVAIGLHDDGSKAVVLAPINKCQESFRCFESKIDNNCQSTAPWSGTIVCDSRNGWYPAAVYHEKTGSCGLAKIKRYTSIKYLKNQILRAIEQPRKTVAPMQCDGFRCKLGECIDKNKTCDGIPHCRSGEDEAPTLCYEKEMQCHLKDNCACPHSQMKCSKTNKCVPKTAFCNRLNDCGDFEDEPDICSCRSYLQLTNPSKICDGIVNCYDHSDETPELCGCQNDHFKCGVSNFCVSNNMTCDGFEDCPHGEDESLCFSLKSDDYNKPNIGEVMTRTAGIWHAGCFKRNHTTSELEEICAKLGFTSGSASQVYEEHLLTLTAPHPVIDQFNVVWIHRSGNNTSNRLKLRMRTGNEPYVTFYPDEDCYRLFIQCE